MLSRPFRGLPRGRLIFMLVLFLLLEGALGAGLYENNRTAAASTPPQELGPVLLKNSSHIVAFGHHAKFASSVAAHQGQYVIYTLRMPDGSQQSARELTDHTGYSAYDKFFIHYTPRAGVANQVTVTVSYNGVLQASSTFPVVGVAR